MWWQDAVVYQIYPRSFQDSDGDGVGDLLGITQRLDHLSYLGVDALRLSPIYPSPLADFGYDVSDYSGVDPVFGSLDDLDALVREAHARGLRVLLDLVPSHTSTEHPWFREHPDRYIWSPVDGPPNNWRSVFGGSAWARDERSGRWFLHTFYPEQADLDWRNPEVVAAMQDVVRFWLDRGVDGFRVDALTAIVKDAELRDDPPPAAPFALPLTGEFGEVYLGTADYARWLEQLDLVFAFELLFSPWEADALRTAIGPAAELQRVAWVLSNHDFDRLASRVGPQNVRAAAVLLLTLPGAAFVYQGDEIGLPDGPGHEPPYDRAGRDRLRHPMQWDRDGGFTSGEPWLPLIDPGERNVKAQRGDPGSLLELYRRLISLRRELGDGFALVDAEPGVVAYDRGGHTVAINTTAEPREAPGGEVVLATHAGRGLPPHAGLIVRK